MFTPKIKTHHGHDQGKIFAWIALISSIGFSSFLTVLPIVLSEKLRSDTYVGYYFSLIALISLAASLFSTILLKKYSKVTVAKWTLGIQFGAFFFLTIAANIWHFVIFDLIRAICVTLFLIVLAIFVRDFAKEKHLALAEGRYYLYANIGWLAGPFLGGTIAKNFGNEGTFIFAGSMYLITLGIFLHEHLVLKNPHIHNRKEEGTMQEFFKNITVFFSQKTLIKSFVFGFGLYFWWAIYKIYVPLTIDNLGYGKDIIGLVISAGMLPLVLLEVFAAKQAEKRGVPKMLGFGYLGLAIVVAAFAFVKESPLLLMLMILANTGAAFIEPLHETHFFQMVEKKDEDGLYGIYNTSYPLANIITPLIGSAILLFSNIKGIWIAAAVIFVSIAMGALCLKKKPEKIEV